MNQAPIIFTAFANNSDEGHLACLKDESSQIKNALLPLEEKDFIKLEREESMELSELYKVLLTYKDRVAIFHFAGHAGGTGVLLESGHAQIAGLLGEQEQLKLVFLNGCSTQGQVDEYFKQGIKAVIATTAPIQDTKAKDFATKFYEALAQKRTIKRAFHLAKSYIQAQYKNSPNIDIIERGEGPMMEIPKAADWLLYIKKGHKEEILNWHLPYFRKTNLAEPILRKIQSDKSVNAYIRRVLNDMCQYNEDIYAQQRIMSEGEEKALDSSQLMSLVIENFPWIIGSQIRLLCIEPFVSLGSKRLEQLLSTYIISTQLIYYILFTDTWELVTEKELKAPKDLLKKQRLSKENLLQFDFLAKAYELYDLIEKADCELFMPEMESLFEAFAVDSSLKKASLYLEKLKTEIGGEISDVQEKCERAERALTVVLKHIAFLSAYKFLAIRFINVENQKCFDLEYELELGKLNGRNFEGLTIYENVENRRKKSFCDCRAIIIVSTEKEVSTFLNLSPFIIDKNTFLNGRLIEPYVYGYEDEANRFHYHTVKHNIYTAFANQKGTDMIHTAMTDKDFDNGTNITDNAKEDDFDLDDEFDFGLEDLVVVEEKGKQVFLALAKQFEQLKSDFL